jgi:pimeloyl-ACP methyl ester carboxylesterase
MYRAFFGPHAGAVADAAVRDARDVPLAVARAELASLAVDTEGMARSLGQPVLWLAVGPIDEQRLAGTFHDVQFGRVVGSGHFPHLEAPEQVGAMLERFLVTRPPAIRTGSERTARRSRR